MKALNLHRVNALVLRHLLTWPRSLERIADSFWWPTMNLFIWGLVNVYLQTETGVTTFFVNLFLGGLLMWTLVARSQEEMGLLFLQEAWDRNLLNMFASPLTIWEFSLATVVLASAKLFVTFLWLFFLALVFFAFNIFSLGWILIPYALILMTAGWSLGFFINGLILQYGYRVQVFAWTLTMIILPFSSVYYPVRALPVWMQSVARTLPTSYVFEGMRGVFLTRQIDLTGFAIAVGLNILYLFLGMWFFAWSYRQAQKTGMIMKFS